MVELEEVDLIKALSRLARYLPRLANDIFIELATVEQHIDLAESLEETARLLRVRAERMPPRVVDLPELPPPGSQNSGPT